jgi:hypothetical protein
MPIALVSPENSCDVRNIGAMALLGGELNEKNRMMIAKEVGIRNPAEK